MPQLHNIYRTIINPSVVSSNIVNDRRNFAKKMLSLGYIKETNKVLTGCSNRPPKLYRFDEDEFKMVKYNEMRQTI